MSEDAIGRAAGMTDQAGASTSEPLLSQKFENEARNFVILFVQGEMAGVKQMYLGVRQIALEGLASRSDKR